MKTACNRALRAAQRGYTLLEVVVALVLVTGLYAIAAESFGPALAFRAEIATKERLEDLHQALYTAYKANALTVDANTGKTLDFGALGTMSEALPHPVNKRCTSTAATILPIARFSKSSAGEAFVDGYGTPQCVFITPQLTLDISGVSVLYHSVAIISAGKNGVIDAGTALDDATGNMTLAGDDIGILMDGQRFAEDRYRASLDAVKKAADAYQAYFAVRYQSDPARSISVDYFSCGDATCPPATANSLWDAGNAMPSTCTAPLAMFQETGISPSAVLGLSKSDVTDGYGNLITLDNCGASVRSPGNATAAMRAPPYTAVITATLPGGATLSQTAVGQF